MGCNRWALGWIIDNAVTDRKDKMFDADTIQLEVQDENNDAVPLTDVENIELEVDNGLEQVRGNDIHVNDIEYEFTIPFKVGDDKRTFTITDVLNAADHLETDELATLIDNLYGDKLGENLKN